MTDGRTSSSQGASTGGRLLVSVAVGLLAGVLVSVLGTTSYGPAVGWDIGAVTLLLWTWLTIGPMTADATASHATREDPTSRISNLLVLGASVASLVGVGVFLVRAHSSSGGRRELLATVGVITVALAWLLVHTVFTLRYARLYYGGRPGGVNFNQSEHPRYTDFAYLAFSIGMTFQVSDTNLQNSTIRAIVLRHALLSFVFGSIIVATTVNLIAGLGG